MNSQPDSCCGSLSEAVASPMPPAEIDCLRAAEQSRLRLLDRVGWLVPSVILAALPKCPICIAAYLSLFTGVGIHISTANSLRVFLIGICALSLIHFAFRIGRIWYVRNRTFTTDG